METSWEDAGLRQGMAGGLRGAITLLFPPGQNAHFQGYKHNRMTALGTATPVIPVDGDQ